MIREERESENMRLRPDASFFSKTLNLSNILHSTFILVKLTSSVFYECHLASCFHSSEQQGLYMWILSYLPDNNRKKENSVL
jgi:hypothetical protein